MSRPFVQVFDDKKELTGGQIAGITAVAFLIGLAAGYGWLFYHTAHAVCE